MEINNSYSKQAIHKKQELLTNARAVLKQEFVGIDEVIDKVIESINTWFLFPELQERPVIINLWGMTGVGKTALITRMATLLDFEKKFFRYDMGKNAPDSGSLENSLKKNLLGNNGMPYMILLDEFQHAKTKDEEEREIDNHFSRVVWDLLDTGKFTSSKFIDHEIGKLLHWKNIMHDSLLEGVEVLDGIVVKNDSVFVDIIDQVTDDIDFGSAEYFHNYLENEKVKYSFVNKELCKLLYRHVPGCKETIIRFRKMIHSLNGPQILELVKQAIENAKSNKWVDGSRTAIFIVGNLDDAYTMSASFNPDINANEFHESSKLININHIKQALKSRFRFEQIARLGNNHIIYPAFDEAGFKKLIELELSKISGKVSCQFGLKLTFTETFKGLVYREGVFPTQGTRPLFSTIYQLVNTKIPRLIAEKILNNIDADVISFDFMDDHVNYEYSKDGWSMYNFDDYTAFSMENLRTPAKGDLQAITAVHESGHAVVTLKALQILPEYICSTSADINSMGFMLTKNKWKYFAREELIPRIAELLGGIVAEKIIFGENKITRGAEEDIERATQLACKAIKDYGMGSISASVHTAGLQSKLNYHDNEGNYNNEVKMLLQEAYAFAEKVLLSEKLLLLQLADYLSDERIIKKEQIEKKVRAYGSSELKSVPFIEEGDHLFYRNELKRQIQRMHNQSIPSEKTEIEKISGISISLNKNS